MGDELAGDASQPVKVEDDEDITAARVVEARYQVGPIDRGSGGVILEHALAADGVERVELAIEDLATFGGGDAGVGDEAHGMCPRKPFSPACYRSAPHAIARRYFRGCRDEKPTNRGLWSGLWAVHDKHMIFANTVGREREDAAVGTDE